MTGEAWSSEPERVEMITSDLFAHQSDAHSVIDRDFSFILRGGADARDDCAWFDFNGRGTLVFGSDYVRGAGFLLYELGHLGNFDVGYYLAAANISDLAAMGAVPLAMTTVVRYPKEFSDEDFRDVMLGIRECTSRFKCPNVGGDIGTSDRLILSAAAVGVVREGSALTRTGAKVGDALMLSGPTGVALAAMVYFEGKERQGWSLAGSDEEELLHSWRRVEPHVDLGQFLSERGLATACQDTSDGLRATVEQLGTASNVRFEVDLSAVPVPAVVERVANLAGRDPYQIVFGGSVDFRLLFTVHPDRVSELPSSCIRIGTARDLADAIPRSEPLPGVAWTHQPDPLAGVRSTEPPI
ncbi:thiamine-phosphate kinase [Agromyces binzhouensis]|uniref:thiamine-phosphate kinase n=1 Tax=Agromyces binzhouensis TaxID=1817495 RepID=UPI00362847B0